MTAAPLMFIKVSLPDELTMGTIPSLSFRVSVNTTVGAVMSLVTDQLNRRQTLPGVLALEDITENYGMTETDDAALGIFLAAEAEVVSLLPPSQQQSANGKLSLSMMRRPTASGDVRARGGTTAPKSSPGPPPKLAPAEDKTPVLDEETEVNRPRPVIGPQTGTVDELIELMLGNKDAATRAEFRAMLLLNHVGFMPSMELFQKLMVHYEKPSEVYATPRIFFVTKIAIVEALLEWADNYPEDLECVTVPGPCQDFFNMLSKGGDDLATDPTIAAAAALHGQNFKGLVKELGDVKTKLKNLKNRMDKAGRTFSRPPPKPPLDVSSMITPEDLQSTAVAAWTLPALMETRPGGLARAIAEQLCMIDAVLLGAVKMREFTNKEWQRAQKAEKAPNVVKMTEAFNSRTYWASTAVLTPDSPAERANVLKLFIKVGIQCLNLRNYYAVFAIFTGLTQTFVLRQKNTWDRLSADIKGRFETLKAFCSTDNNTSVYRKEQRRGELRKLPQIPYLVVMLDDLYKLEEIPSRGDDGKVNWHKFAREWTVQAIFRDWMAIQGYMLQGEVMVRKAIEAGMSSAKSLEELWDLSFKHEPKSEAHTFQQNWKKATPEEKNALYLEQKSKVNALFIPIEEARRTRAEREKVRLEEELAARNLRAERNRQLDAAVIQARAQREELEKQRRRQEEEEKKERDDKEAARCSEEFADAKKREEELAQRKKQDEEKIRPALEMLAIVEKLRSAEGKAVSDSTNHEDHKLAGRLQYLAQGVIVTKLVRNTLGKEHAVQIRVVKVGSMSQSNTLQDLGVHAKKDSKQIRERVVHPKAEGEWRVLWNTSSRMHMVANSKRGWLRAQDIQPVVGNEAGLFRQQRYKSKFTKHDVCLNLMAEQKTLSLVFESKLARDTWLSAFMAVKHLSQTEAHVTSTVSPRGSCNVPEAPPIEKGLFDDVDATQISLDDASTDEEMGVATDPIDITAGSSFNDILLLVGHLDEDGS